MTIIKERLAQFGTMELLKGSHDDGNGKCGLEAVAPMVAQLQESAFDLLDRMINV